MCCTESCLAQSRRVRFAAAGIVAAAVRAVVPDLAARANIEPQIAECRKASPPTLCIGRRQPLEAFARSNAALRDAFAFGKGPREFAVRLGCPETGADGLTRAPPQCIELPPGECFAGRTHDAAIAPSRIAGREGNGLRRPL